MAPPEFSTTACNRPSATTWRDQATGAAKHWQIVGTQRIKHVRSHRWRQFWISVQHPLNIWIIGAGRGLETFFHQRAFEGRRRAGDELAQLLGASRQRVNQELKAMEREDAIRIEPGGLVVRDREALMRIAEADN